MDAMPAPVARAAAHAGGAARPVVLVPACNRVLGTEPMHVVGRKYVQAVRLAGGLPWVVPDAQADELDELLDAADGVLLTGSPSNVHPARFGAAVHDARLPLDARRDDWVLPLVPRVLARGIPLLAICRGLQEANVALGGSLHQAVQELPGRLDHRASDELPPERAYAPVHEVNVEPGGTLAALLDGLPDDGGRIRVNSLHGQGVDRLADGLRVEARAPDGLIEAFSSPHAPGFNLCVQWHPEWQAADGAVSRRLFNAFGAACTAHRQRRRAPHREPDPDR
jgi:putative glutamine amidotransferase